MTYCRICGTLGNGDDTSGERIICEDCADKLEEKITTKKKEKPLPKKVQKEIDILKEESKEMCKQMMALKYSFGCLPECRKYFEKITKKEEKKEK